MAQIEDIDDALEAVPAREAGPVVIGIDVGGTSVKMGVVTQRGEIIATAKVPTGALEGAEALGRVSEAAVELARGAGVDTASIAGIGLDVPGVVLEDGTLAMAPNITLDLDGLREALAQAFPAARIATINDANAAALGETWVGAGAGADSLVMLTLGTGVGGGVVVGGRVIAGTHGAAGEIGHLCMNFDETETCGCGRRGCLEQYASARGLIRLYREECATCGAPEVEIAHATDALAVFEAARSGNAQAKRACERLGTILARALAALAVMVDPDAFVLGGGMCGGWDTFGQTCVDAYRTFVIPGCAETPIRVATLGNAAGLLGAARHALAALQ